MCGKIRQNKIKNENNRKIVRVTFIVEKMIENRLRWFGHLNRRSIDYVVWRIEHVERRKTIREKKDL